MDNLDGASDAEIEELLLQLRAENTALGLAIARKEASQPHRVNPYRERKPHAVSALIDREGIAVADRNFKLIAFDAEAKAILDELWRESGGEGGATDIPAGIIELLRARPGDSLGPVAASLSAGESRYTCRCAIMQSPKGHPVTPALALYLKKEVSVAEIVRRVGQDYQLTPREQEVLVGVSMGLTSKELGKRIGVSPHTIKAFLHTIMVKMDTTTRAGVVGKVLGNKAGGEP